MGKEEEDIELIEKYLEDTLELEGRKTFEARLLKDREFNDLFDDISKLVRGIELVGSEETLAYLKKLEETLPEVHPETIERSIPVWRQRNFMGIAASVVMILAAGFYLFDNESPDQAALFDQYFEVYPNQILPTKRGDYQPETQKEKAYYAYDLGDFEEAMKLFKLLPQDQDGGAALFYTGMAALSGNDPQSAIVTFNDYMSRYTVFADTARWFLALSYLKNDQSDRATMVLKEVIRGKNSYSIRARELLTALE